MVSGPYILLHVKIYLVLSVAYCNHLLYIRPNSPASEQERQDHDRRRRHLNFLSNLGLSLTTLWVAAVYFVALCDVYITSCQLLPALIIPPVYSSITSGTGVVRLTPTFLIGCAMVYAGTYLRLLCFRTLGKFFTFELAIRKDHKLCTSGPYAVVRHPSYTAILGVSAGLSICYFSDGSVWAARKVGETSVGRAVEYFWIAVQILTVPTMFTRMKSEDMVLKENFGDEWVMWCKKTPYKLIPDVY